MIYTIAAFFLFSAGFYLLSVTGNINKKLFFYYLYIVLFWGISYHYAIDTPVYMEYYQSVRPISEGLQLHLNRFEPGFNLLAALCKTLSDRYVVFQTIVFSVEMFLITLGLRKMYKEESVLVVPLLFFIFPIILNALRQSLAIAIFIYSLPMIKEPKPWRYFLCIIGAAMFHQSAIFLLLLYLTKHVKKMLDNNFLIFVILGISDLMWLGNISLSTNIGLLQDILMSDYLDMGGKYLKNYVSDNEFESNYGFAKILEINFVTIMYLLYEKKMNYNDLFRLVLIIYIIFGMIFGGLFAHRVLYYFDILYYLCFIVSIKRRLNDSMKWGYIVVALYMFWFSIVHCSYYQKEYILLFI